MIGEDIGLRICCRDCWPKGVSVILCVLCCDGAEVDGMAGCDQLIGPGKANDIARPPGGGSWANDRTPYPLADEVEMDKFGVGSRGMLPAGRDVLEKSVGTTGKPVDAGYF